MSQVSIPSTQSQSQVHVECMVWWDSLHCVCVQVEVEVHGSAGQTGFHALCLELLGRYWNHAHNTSSIFPSFPPSLLPTGTLKRSLTQQYEVKIALYQVCVYRAILKDIWYIHVWYVGSVWSTLQ